MTEEIASLLVYAGLLCLPFAPLAGLGCIVIGFAIPPRRHAAREVRTELDRYIPQWSFAEVHSITVSAPAASVFRAVLDTTPDEILFYQTLTAIRRIFGSGGMKGTNILQAAGGRPLFESAELGGFFRVAQVENREIVEGAHIGSAIRTAMNFTLEANGVLRTETRVEADDWKSRRLFACYWRLIYPGSSLIRYMWLRAIRKRAEQQKP